MKKTHSTLIAVIAGVSTLGVAQGFTVDKVVSLDTLVTVPGSTETQGIYIGGPDYSEHPGVTQTSSITKTSDYTAVNGVIGTKQGWYTDTLNSNVGDAPRSNAVNGTSVLFITDGPARTAHPNFGVAGFTLTATTVQAMAAVESGFTLSFNVSVPTGNNNRNDQSIGFRLLSAAGDSAETTTYSNPNKTGTAAQDISLTLTAGQVADLAAAGTDQTLYFMVYDTDNTDGSNEGWVLKNFKASYTIPEPATATLSLLALAGLAARRRRK